MNSSGRVDAGPALGRMHRPGGRGANLSLGFEDPQLSFENSRLRLLQSNLMLKRLGLPALAVVAGGLFLIWNPPAPVATWVIAQSLVSIFAASVLERKLTNVSSVEEAHRRIVLAGTLMALVNSCWALAAIVFWVPGNMASDLVVIALLSSVMLISAASLAVSLRAFAMAVAPLVAMLVFRPLVVATPTYLGIAAIDLTYCCVIAAIAHHLHVTAATMLRVKEDNADLLVQVARAKAESDAARYRAERLNQAKSTFLAKMSHELRTPLNAILGFSEVIHGELLGPIGTPAYKDYAGDIHVSGKHLLGLINDILDLSRIEAGRLDLSPAVLRVSEIVSDMLRLVNGAAKKSEIHLEQQVEPGLPLIRADERAIRQILLNLLSNAIKFTPKTGRVIIGAKKGSSVFGDAGLTLWVEDSGIGMKKEDLATALEAFGQVRVEDLAMTASHEQGTGLGLPIVRGLTEAHGGQLVLESQPGIGTRATIHLPPSCVLRPEEIDYPPREVQQARRA